MKSWGMKRALVGMAIVILGLAAAWAFWNPSRNPPMPDAARLVPAETLILAECPDLPGSALRWRETALAQILREPEVEAFLAVPRIRLHQNELWSRTLGPLARVQPRSAFLAVASITHNMPHAVAGCAFAGERKEMETLLAEARAQAQATSPHGRLERENYGQFQLETFTDNGITMAAALSAHAVFVANDVELLKSTLDRFSGKTPVALDSSRAYRQSLKCLPKHPDFRLFVQPNPFSDKLLAQLSPPASPETGKIEALALGAKFEGALLRERLFVLQPPTASRPQLSHKTLGLTTPHTLFYGAMAPLFAEDAPTTPHAVPLANPMRVLLSALNAAAPPATFAQFKTAFGPEHALLLDWPQTRAQPNLFLALEVRDPGNARKFVESAFRAWSRADAAGVSFWINPGNAPIHPAVALTQRHFLAGLSPESLAPFASSAVHAPAQEGTLAQSPTFVSAMASVATPQIGMAYLDARPFFERFYGWLRPTILFWGSVKLGNVCDFGRLPFPAPISRHLTPISLSATQTRAGVLLESTGPVTFMEVSAGLGAAASAILLPTLQVVPSLPGPQGKSPLLPSPLSAPDAPEPSSEGMQP
jgi:hypothetical protein